MDLPCALEKKDPTGRRSTAEKASGTFEDGACAKDGSADDLPGRVMYEPLGHGEVGYAGGRAPAAGFNRSLIQEEPVQKWEYATVPLISHALQEILNQWGEEGWELVQIVESSATGTVGYLKRPKGQPARGAGSDST
jgi:hypothetical protein